MSDFCSRFFGYSICQPHIYRAKYIWCNSPNHPCKVWILAICKFTINCLQILSLRQKNDKSHPVAASMAYHSQRWLYLALDMTILRYAPTRCCRIATAKWRELTQGFMETISENFFSVEDTAFLPVRRVRRLGKRSLFRMTSLRDLHGQRCILSRTTLMPLHSPAQKGWFAVFLLCCRVSRIAWILP